ncbi:hypothetical protein OH77DRAFT_1230798 [Trametes cingulata]|nr:hypothetical protein OH77DRAFT_1230798 [Trametes cingulata]
MRISLPLSPRLLWLPYCHRTTPLPCSALADVHAHPCVRVKRYPPPLSSVNRCATRKSCPYHPLRLSCLRACVRVSHDHAHAFCTAYPLRPPPRKRSSRGHRLRRSYTLRLQPVPDAMPLCAPARTHVDPLRSPSTYPSPSPVRSRTPSASFRPPHRHAHEHSQTPNGASPAERTCGSASHCARPTPLAHRTSAYVLLLRLPARTVTNAPSTFLAVRPPPFPAFRDISYICLVCVAALLHHMFVSTTLLISAPDPAHSAPSVVSSAACSCSP